MEEIVIQVGDVGSVLVVPGVDERGYILSRYLLSPPSTTVTVSHSINRS